MYSLRLSPRNFITFCYSHYNKPLDLKIVFGAFVKISYFHCSTKCLKKADFGINDEFDYSQGLEQRFKVNYEAIAGENNEKLETLKLLLMELEMSSQNGQRLPKMIGTHQWQTLLSLSNTERNFYLNHLLNIENNRDITEKENLKNQIYFSDQNCLKGLFCETIIERLPELYYLKLLRALMYGPHIIIDCGFEKLVSRANIWKIAHYMFETLAQNRILLNPFNIIHCNMDCNGELYSSFMELVQSLKLDPALSVTCTEKSYLDLFPKNELVYLSSYAKTNMKTFDSNKVYIIEPMFLQESEKRRIKTFKENRIPALKLPYQEHLNSVRGRPEITLSNYFKILSDLKDGCSWDISLRHLYKQQAPDQSYLQRRMKRSKNQIHEKFREDFLQNLDP